MELLENDAKKLNSPLKFHALTDETIPVIESFYKNKYEFFENRDWADYIYLSQNMAELSGKKLHAKRNFINKFNSLYNGNYEFKPITSNLIPEIKSFNTNWQKTNEKFSNEHLTDEHELICYALDNFIKLKLIGVALFVDGKIAAFTYGSAINKNVFDIHVEKADTSYQGAYAVINNLFAKELIGYKFLNREEDMGLDGLRKAKLSYYPHKILVRYSTN